MGSGIQSKPLAILPLPEVCRRTGLSRATVYRYMRAQRFPKSVRRGWANVGWLESDIEAFVLSCIQPRHNSPGATDAEQISTTAKGYEDVLDASAKPPKATTALLDSMDSYEASGIQWR